MSQKRTWMSNWTLMIFFDIVQFDFEGNNSSKAESINSYHFPRLIKYLAFGSQKVNHSDTDVMAKKRKLVVAEDCAGLGPLIPALKFLGWKFVQVHSNNLHSIKFSTLGTLLRYHHYNPKFLWIRLRMVGLQGEAYYMSEVDSNLRSRLQDLYGPRLLSDDCCKYKGSLSST